MDRTNRLKAGIFHLNGKEIFIYSGINQIGRKQNAVVVLKDPAASQDHAQFIIINDKHYVTDLKSTNGSFLNGTKLTAFQLYELHDGDLVQFAEKQKGNYTKLTDFLTPEEVSLVANQTQLSQTQSSNFYAATTQIEDNNSLRILQSNNNFSKPQKSEEATQKMSPQAFFKMVIRDKGEKSKNDEKMLENEECEEISDSELPQSQIVVVKNRNKSRIIASDTESDAEVDEIKDANTKTDKTSENSEKLPSCSLNLQLSVSETNDDVHSDESTDFLQMLTINDATNAEKIVIHPHEIENVSNIPLESKLSKEETIASDTDVEDNDKDHNDAVSTSKPDKLITPNKSMYIISSSDDEEEPKKTADRNESKNDEEDEEDDSIMGWGKSKCDISLNEVPPTQDVTIRDVASNLTANESYKLGLSHIDELTESLDASKTRKSNAEISLESQELDFLAPTQPLWRMASKMKSSNRKVCSNTSQNIDYDDFLAPTQKLAETSFTPENIDYNNDVFLAPTQPLQPRNNIDTREEVDNEFDFIAPTQPLLPNLESEKVKTANIVNSNQSSNEKHVEIGKSVDKQQTAVESQLEVLFASQNANNCDTNANRPSNPMSILFNDLQTQDNLQSTQEIVQTLSRCSRKRSSDECDSESSDSSQKRVKLDKVFPAKETSPKENVTLEKKRGILSLKKRDKDDEISDDEPNFNPLEDIHSDEVNNENETKKSAEKPKRRQILDDDSLSRVEYPTPPRNSMSINRTITYVEKVPKTSENKGKRGRSSLQTSTKSKTRKQKAGKTKQTRSGSDSEEEKKTLNPPRRSGRLKKTISYSETSVNLSKSSEDKTEMEIIESDILQNIVVRVPKRQVIIVPRDEDAASNERNDISTIVQDCLKPKPRKVRAKTRIQHESVKPKIAFTMLDDPALKAIIRSLGGSIVETIDASTVLVTKTIQRTLKLLAAMGDSKPICSPEWLRACAKANRFLDPWEYIIVDDEAETKWRFSMKESLERSKQGKLYQGFVFQVITTTAADTIKGAIVANGGKVTGRKGKGSNFIIVAAEHPRTRYCSYIVENIRVVSSEAILIGILRQKIVFDEYSLQ